MAYRDSGPPSWVAGRGKPPAWFRLFGCLAFIAVAAGMFARRGVVTGVVAVVVYGWLALCSLAWERRAGWSKRHPLLDRSVASLLFLAMPFLALAYATRIPTVCCLLIAVGAGPLLMALAYLCRRARQRNGP